MAETVAKKKTKAKKKAAPKAKVKKKAAPKKTSVEIAAEEVPKDAAQLAADSEAAIAKAQKAQDAADPKPTKAEAAQAKKDAAELAKAQKAQDAEDKAGIDLDNLNPRQRKVAEAAIAADNRRTKAAKAMRATYPDGVPTAQTSKGFKGQEKRATVVVR